MICGHIGCGRYVSRHAYKHFEETQHTYAMQLTNHRVWDYAGGTALLMTRFVWENREATAKEEVYQWGTISVVAVMNFVHKGAEETQNISKRESLFSFRVE